MNLDADHLEKVKDPNNSMNFKYYVPEGMVSDPKKVLQNLNSYRERSTLSDKSLLKPTKGIKA
jgi:hypothetical protein